MGDYTRLELDVNLRDDVPDEVVSALRFLLRGELPESVPSHPFFTLRSATRIAIGGSAYHEYLRTSTLQNEDNHQHLRISSSLKSNHDEIDEFIDWISPYIDVQPGELLGYIDHPSSHETISPLVWSGQEIIEVYRDPDGLSEARFGGWAGAPECSYAGFVAAAGLPTDYSPVELVRKITLIALEDKEILVNKELLDGPLTRPQMDYFSEYLANAVMDMPAFRPDDTPKNSY